MPEWSKWLLGVLGGPLGLALVGAESAYSSSRALEKNKWETAAWTLSGLFIGNFGVVAANFDEAMDQSDFGYMIDKDCCNLMFDMNPHYSFWTSLMYAWHMKKNYYSNDSSRSVSGIDFELLFHYGLYALGLKAGTDGAWIQKFESTPQGVIESKDGVWFEVLGFLWNPILYFFR